MHTRHSDFVIRSDDGPNVSAPVLARADEARFVAGTEIIVDGGMVARCD